MDIRKLQRAIVDGLEDVKGQNIAVFNTEHLSALFERVIIASGTSNRQTKALAASVRDSVKKRGMAVLATEGEDNGEWIIVDCGAAVAHIMQPAIREYYHLEEIWGGKSVRMNKADVSTKLVKASEPERPARKSAGKAPATAMAKPAARPAAQSAPAKKRAPAGKPGMPKAVVAQVAATKVANRTAAFKRVAAKSPPVKKASAKAAPARSAPARPAPARSAPVKSTPSKSAPVKSTSSRSAAVKSAPAKKAPARKTPARGKPAAATSAPARKSKPRR